MTGRFLVESSPAGPARGAVLLLHGGRVTSHAADRQVALAPLRMYTFHRALVRAGSAGGLYSGVVRFRSRGWNDADPVPDAEGAIDAVRRRFGGIPICLVGHSMGARVALRVAGQDSVTAVCALAPWLPAGEPVRQVAGRTILIAHGDRDRTTSPGESLAYAQDAVHHADDLARFVLLGAGHKLIRRSRLWHDLTCRFTLGALQLAPYGRELSAAFGQDPRSRIRLPL